MCLMVSGACSGGAGHHQPAAHRTATEPAAGVALVRAHLGPSQAETTGDGSLVLTYEGGHHCYFRQVHSDGTVTGWLRKAHAGCPAVVRVDSGLLGSDAGDFTDAVDLSDPLHETRVAVTHEEGEPQAGDTYLGRGEFGKVLCSIFGTDDVPHGCAYSPRSHGLYLLPRSVLAIDSRGRIWSAGAHNTVTVSDGTKSSASQPLPAAVDQLMVRGDSAALWTRTPTGDMFVSDDTGTSWTRVTEPPQAAQDPELAYLLPDGRVLLGPYNGQLWRGTDATNTTYDALDAGPITTVLSSGHRLYGLADQAPEHALHHLVWMSADDGTTWRQVIDAAGDARTAPAAPAADLRLPAQPSAADRISQLGPHDVALGRHGLVLVTYGRGPKSAWRLYDRMDRIVAEGLTRGADVDAAGDGFVLSTDAGVQFVDAAGRSVPVDFDFSARRPVTSGDTFVQGGWVFRRSDLAEFTGTASPDGLVYANDGRGRMWALGNEAPGRTVVRSAVPGGPWTSHDLGPGIGARDVQGTGSTLLVPGRRTMYVSLDAGATWTLELGPYPQGEGPASFRVWPDGTIITGDYRAPYRISHDGARTFTDPAAGEDVTPRLVGDLFARGAPGATEVSQDREHWRRFTPDLVRQLLRNDSS